MTPFTLSLELKRTIQSLMILTSCPLLSHHRSSSCFRSLRQLASSSHLAFPTSSPTPYMESESTTPSLLVLCGKSAAENELAKSLKNNNAMKLLGDDEVEVVLYSEVEDSLGNEGLHIRDYFKSLLTMSLGRFLLYSPRLPSTQDIVARNFCELPVGAVCVADVQFKGRGIMGVVLQ
nr:biotin--protein ligase 2-like isoform X1 [Ipomoea batatas]